jgi:hypothetical protein
MLHVASHLLAVPANTTETTVDRRRRPRLKLAYALRLSRPSDGLMLETRTEDISCEGFYCFAHTQFAPNETLDCELTIPTEELGRPVDLVVLRCRIRVVRVVPEADRYGIACCLEDYTISRRIARAPKV